MKAYENYSAISEPRQDMRSHKVVSCLMYLCLLYSHSFSFSLILLPASAFGFPNPGGLFGGQLVPVMRINLFFSSHQVSSAPFSHLVH